MSLIGVDPALDWPSPGGYPAADLNKMRAEARKTRECLPQPLLGPTIAISLVAALFWAALAL